MAEINLSKYGITGTTEVVYNPSYEMLFEEETKSTLEGFEKGRESELGAVNVMTGVYTGRSPKDKFIVMDENSKDTVWWTSDEYKNDNHPATQEAWNSVKELALKELSNKRLFVVDAFCVSVSCLYFTVSLIRVHTQCHVGRQCPRSCGPCQEISVFADHFKANDRGAFFYGFVSLRYFLCGKRCSTARTVRYDLESFI